MNGSVLHPTASTARTTVWSSSLSRLLWLLLLTCFSIVVVGQNAGTTSVDTSTEGWKDQYKLAYSYDDLRTNGPSQWGSVAALASSSSNSIGGWGEWSVVNLASTQTNQDDQPLLTDWSSGNNQCGPASSSSPAPLRPSPIELTPFATCTDSREILIRKFDSTQDCRHPKEDTNRQGSAFASSSSATVTSYLNSWEITPYSLRFYFPRTDKTCRRPTLRLDGIFGLEERNVEEHFVLLWLELHARSEHVIDGKRYDAELQMVHMATTRPNELAIVSVLIEADADLDNSIFQEYLLDGWQAKYQQEVTTCASQRKLQRDRPHLRGDQRTSSGGHWNVLQEYLVPYNSTTTTTTKNNNIDSTQQRRQLQQQQQQGGGGGGGGGGRCQTDKYGNGCQSVGMGPRRRMFPYNLWPSSWYYSYVGSLTSPPCLGQVHWRIMDVPLHISRRQYKQLTYLLTQSRDDSCQPDTATNLQGENFRPLQNATIDSSTVNKQAGGGNNNNNNNNNNEDALEGPQLVSHCTSDNFFVLAYSSDEQ